MILRATVFVGGIWFLIGNANFFSILLTLFYQAFFALVHFDHDKLGRLDREKYAVYCDKTASLMKDSFVI